MSDQTKYIRQEVDAALDQRFDRVIGSISSGSALIKTRVGKNTMSTMFVKENGRWTTKARVLKQIPQIKH